MLVSLMILIWCQRVFQELEYYREYFQLKVKEGEVFVFFFFFYEKNYVEYLLIIVCDNNYVNIVLISFVKFEIGIVKYLYYKELG